MVPNMQTFWVMMLLVPLGLIGLAALVSLRTGRRSEPDDG